MMASLIETFPALGRFFAECAETLSGVAEDRVCIDRVQWVFSKLLAERETFGELLRRVAEGGDLLDLRRPTMFDNEVLVHADPSRLFSLRLYLYGPGRYTPVHDHNSWGVLGGIGGQIEVTSYARRDDGSQPGYADLVEKETLTLPAGAVTSTLPLNDGIHRVGNRGPGTVPSLNLYGKPIARGYVNGFDVGARRVYQILSPVAKKRVLAGEAAETLKHGPA